MGESIISVHCPGTRDLTFKVSDADGAAWLAAVRDNGASEDQELAAARLQVRVFSPGGVTVSSSIMLTHPGCVVWCLLLNRLARVSSLPF